MTTVVVSPFDVVSFPDGAGHFWVYMQYVQGLRRLGCDVYWLEQVQRGKHRDSGALATFRERMECFGMAQRALLYTRGDGARDAADDAPIEWLDGCEPAARDVFRRADLLLNFHYGIDPRILGEARRSALVDIDPGLTQIWMSSGQIRVPAHDVYFTIGETVGTAAAPFPDCGLAWRHIRPPVCLELWPYVHDPTCESFTTVAGWWSGKWVKLRDNGKEVCIDNNKRVAFLGFAELPALTAQPLELALHLAEGDGADRRLLEQRHWRVRHAREIASTPQQYQSYIQGSRGEWSCAKPFFVKLQNAWVSDRTVCYLASGKPAVVQHTGPSAYLPHGEGMFRFKTVDEAAASLDAINTAYEHHCRAAREIAVQYFDAKRVLAGLLQEALQ